MQTLNKEGSTLSLRNYTELFQIWVTSNTFRDLQDIYIILLKYEHSLYTAE